MKAKMISISLWVVAAFFTIAISYYQKTTGPTWPVKLEISIDGQQYSSKLLRSHYTDSALPLKITTGNDSVSGNVKYKRFGIDEPYTTVAFINDSGVLSAFLPAQPPAGKIEYIISIFDAGKKQLPLNIKKPIVARFKGRVSTVVLIFHIIFMFLGVLLAIKTLINCLVPGKNYISLLYWTFGSIFIGGMIFGPIVQKSAFGDYWTGFPFGTDLTDNKVLISLIIWSIAILFKNKRSVVIASAIFMLFIYFIPHSVMGSELDYKTGKMKNKFSKLILPENEKNCVINYLV